MKTTNAVKMRQNLGSVLRQLSATMTPILIEQRRKPVAVLISLEDYKKRFVDVEADAERERIVENIKKARLPLPKGKTSLDLIRELRHADDR